MLLLDFLKSIGLLAGFFGCMIWTDRWSEKEKNSASSLALSVGSLVSFVGFVAFAYMAMVDFARMIFANA